MKKCGQFYRHRPPQGDPPSSPTGPPRARGPRVAAARPTPSARARAGEGVPTRRDHQPDNPRRN